MWGLNGPLIVFSNQLYVGKIESRLAKETNILENIVFQHLLLNFSETLNFIILLLFIIIIIILFETLDFKGEFLGTAWIKVWANWKWKVLFLNHCQRPLVLCT